MILDFEIGVYTFRDVDALSDAEEKQVTQALLNGLGTIPEKQRCDGMALDAHGDYQMMRFGVFANRELVGAWWIGCNRQTRASSKSAVVIDAVPLGGWLEGHEDFMTADTMFEVCDWLLNNDIELDDRTTTIRVASWTISLDIDTGERDRAMFLKNAAAEIEASSAELTKESRAEIELFVFRKGV